MLFQLILEWATLSKHTGNDTYRELAEKSFRHIAELPSPLPGLAAQGIDPTTGEFVGGYVVGLCNKPQLILSHPKPIVLGRRR